MGTENIPILQLLVLYLLLLIPVAIFRVLRIPLTRKLVIAVVRMSLQLVFVGIYLQYVFEWNSPYLNIGWVVIMVIVANFNVSGNIGARRSKIFPLTIAGLLVSTFGILAALLLIGVRPSPIYDARYMIPLGGMVLGNCLRGNILALERFLSGIRKNETEYATALFMGATTWEASLPFLRNALLASLTPLTSTMATIGLVSLPGMMTGQILGGSLPVVAIKYQIAIMIAIYTSAAISTLVNLLLLLKTGFHENGFLRIDLFKKV